MSNDPWEVQPQEARTYYAKCQIVRTERTGSKGNKYFQMEFWLTPIGPGKEVINRKFFNFQPGWEKITIPSVMKLVQDKKIAQPIKIKKPSPSIKQATQTTIINFSTKLSIVYPFFTTDFLILM